MSAEGQPPLVCGRFPSMRVCGCTIPCQKATKEATLDRVRPGLFIGPIQAAYLDSQLKDEGIRAVINVSGAQYTKRRGIDYLELEVDDCDDADILPAIRLSFDFIRGAVAKAAAVLVHCNAGKSRSAAICTAWIMASEGVSVEKALESVQACHPRAEPNDGFLAQLEQLEKEPPDWFHK